MKRAYYNSTTGTIEEVVPVKLATKTQSKPFIDVEDSFVVNEYKINLETGQLERLPDELIPRVRRR